MNDIITATDFARHALAIIADFEQGNADEDGLELDAQMLLQRVAKQSSALHFLISIVDLYEPQD